MLKFDNVSKIYKTGTFGGQALHAVNNVSFDVNDREVVSLIGESGSGKSTIGKMILRLTQISSGSIQFNQVDISKIQKGDLKDYYRTVQGVFQDPFSSYNPIFKADRVFEIIRKEFFPGIGSKEWSTKVENSLAAVGLNPEQIFGKYPHQLSGGQLQRILIARALLLEIQFLVADEIISMLDASTRIDVLNLLADLRSRGLSILFITHDLSLANYISERAVILYRGCITEMGATDKIFENPLHPYTRMLLASVPRLDKKWEEVEVDLKTQPAGLVSACSYYGRCPVADKALGCDAFQPALSEVEPGHLVACFHYQDAFVPAKPEAALS